MELSDLDRFERDARRSKCDQILRVQAEDPARMAEISQLEADRSARAPEAVGALRQLQATGDGAAFASYMEGWSRRPGYDSFSGPNGQMFLKQVLGAGEPGEGAALLGRVLEAPVDDADAGGKLTQALAFVERVKRGGHPAPGRTPFLLSFFWALQDPERWPVQWKSSRRALLDLGWFSGEGDLAVQYLEFASLVRSLGSPEELSNALFWFDSRPFVGLAPGLIDRCVHGKALAALGTESGYPDPFVEEAAEQNNLALTYEVWLAASALRASVSEALGRPVKVRAASRRTAQDLHRWWTWSAWQPDGERVSIRLAATVDGVVIGLFPGWVNNDWYDESGRIAAEHLPEGLQFFQTRLDDDYGRYRPAGERYPGGEFLVGRLFPGTSALDRADLGADVVALVAQLQPLVDRLSAASVTSTAPVDPTPATASDGGDLARLVAEFKATSGFPTEKDHQDRSDRERFAKLLAPDVLTTADTDSLRQIINTGRYGGPGPQSVLNSTLASLGTVEQERFFALLSNVLWGAEPVEQRIDRALSPEQGFKGLGEAVLMKILAIAHPDRFVPVFPFNGEHGKASLMRLIGLEPPPAACTRGEKQVRANDAIHDLLEPHFPGDTWAQARFLYWLRNRPSAGPGEDIDPVPELAGDLLLGEPFIRELLDLLQAKGQVIFYGPPGTGKTFVAQRIAEALTSDPAQRMLVQFHPSTSYEDFFEGYRPEPGLSGQLTYRLVPGPLARLAAAAKDAPGIKHVMVIDEINRANLPKVLGELLFLLEYRDHPIQTLYRPDEPFELPDNLYFIGTMNTADRSVALIDAAMRRRFHFVPFFPHEAPHSEVLGAWLESHNPELSWIAGLVEQVNTRLTDLLGGPHLQIGPSHFMKEGLDEAGVKRIWRFSIMPFIEDLFWGQPDQIKSFEYNAVLASYQKDSGGETGSPPTVEQQVVEAAVGDVAPPSAGGTPPQLASGTPGGTALEPPAG